MTHFHAGYNMPGYLPEMDVATFSDFVSAKAFMLSEMARDLDYATDDEEEESRLEELSSEAEDLNLDNGPEWGTVVGNTSYWITPCADPECEEDDNEF